MPNLKRPNWFERLASTLERILLMLTEPSRHSLTLSIATDLPRSKSQLIAENALFRQQLITRSVHRQVNQPRFTHPSACGASCWLAESAIGKTYFSS